MLMGSLFSGIGGLELGLEWAGLGQTIWQVEQDEWCRRVLAKHWPEADRSVMDVRQAGSRNLARVDLICGGFPCQDVSSAGPRIGLAGARSGLWYEFARVVGEMRPQWVVVENVASGAKKWVDAVRRDLGRIGYESLPIPLEARDVGAPHIRARIFVLAYAERERREALATPRLHAARASGHYAHRCGMHAFPPGRGDAEGWRDYVRNGGPEPGLRRGSDGFSRELDGRRLTALGNSAIPQDAEVAGWVIRHLMAGRPALLKETSPRRTRP